MSATEVVPLILDGASIPKKLKARQWQLRSFLAPDGELYIPAAAADNENAVFLAVAFDGVGCVRHDGHLYAPLSWLEREYPDLKELWNAVRHNLQRFHEEEGFWQP